MSPERTIVDGPAAKQSILESAREQERQGQLEAALGLYSQADELETLSWPVRFGHARVLYELGRLAEVKRIFEDFVTRANPPSAQALNDLGVSAAESGDYLSAVKSFVQALRCEAAMDISHVLGNLGFVLYKLGQGQKAASVLESALQLNPDEDRVHYLISVLEATRPENSQSRPAAEIAADGQIVQVFRPVRWSDQVISRHNARIVGDHNPRVHLTDTVRMTSTCTEWGILVSDKDQLWCGFARQAAGNSCGAQPVIPLPEHLHQIQRRRWIRVGSPRGITQIKVCSFPPGVEPFAVESLQEINLSAGGMAFRTLPQVPVGCEVTVSLALADEGQVEVRGRVSRVRAPEAVAPYSILVFESMDEADRGRLARYVNQVLQNQKQEAQNN